MRGVGSNQPRVARVQRPAGVAALTRGAVEGRVGVDVDVVQTEPWARAGAGKVCDQSAEGVSPSSARQTEGSAGAGGAAVGFASSASASSASASSASSRSSPPVSRR